MRVPHVSSAVARSCAALVCAALVANAPLNTVLEASTYQPTPEVQQLRFDVLAAGAQVDNQLIFPSELIAATDAPAKPLTSAERAERAERVSLDSCAPVSLKLKKNANSLNRQKLQRTKFLDAQNCIRWRVWSSASFCARVLFRDGLDQGHVHARQCESQKNSKKSTPFRLRFARSLTSL